MNLRKYYEKINKKNIEEQNKLREKLKKLNLNATFMVVGSDARLENSKKSLFDLIVYSPAPVSIDFKEINDVELKFPNSDPIKYEKCPVKKYFPSRGIDAALIYGDSRDFFEYKKKVFNRLLSKEAYKALKEKKREFKKIMKTGKNKIHGEIKVHFDLEKGLAYYDNSYRLSFKLGPLRYVQTFLNLELVKYLQTFRDFLAFFEYPRRISERFEFFRNLKYCKLNESDCETIIDDYIFFLKKYHDNQRLFFDKKEREMIFDKNEIKERLKSIETILNRPFLFF